MTANLSVLHMSSKGEDIEIVVKAGTPADRFFPPLLAAQIMISVRGLVEHDCDSRPEQDGKDGSRRWAFAQEIYSNRGLGTESGHFLEHLALQMASEIHADSGGPSRVMAAETEWDFRVEPDTYRVFFHNIPEPLLRQSLARCREVLARARYRLDLTPIGAD